jgi:hypothetical protein
MAVSHPMPLELGWQTWTIVALVLVMVVLAALLLL